MKKQVIHTDQAPKAIGPYSQAVRYGHFLFLSGQMGINPANGNLVNGGFEAEARQVFSNIQAILESEKSGMDRILKTTVYLTNIEDFALLNGIYGTFIPEPYPARTTVQVAALPKGAHIEVELIAEV
ncbi:MAG: RidA family protein [Spirochaetales bacterium]|nr:RidA family protein [Spirochaetales bacterium]